MGFCSLSFSPITAGQSLSHVLCTWTKYFSPITAVTLTLDKLNKKWTFPSPSLSSDFALQRTSPPPLPPLSLPPSLTTSRSPNEPWPSKWHSGHLPVYKPFTGRAASPPPSFTQTTVTPINLSSPPSPPTIPQTENRITIFLIKAHQPHITEIVPIPASQECKTACELCDYLLQSTRARTHLLSHINSVPEFDRRKVHLYHPLFPSPLLLRARNRDDKRFRAQIRAYYRRLYPGVAVVA